MMSKPNSHLVESYMGRDWRKVLAAAGVPFLIVTLWYCKNLALFGEFTGSTWSGMNFSKVTSSMLTASELLVLHDNGIISATSLVAPFSFPNKYYSAVPKPPLTGIPVLDQERKASDAPNFNNAVFIEGIPAVRPRCPQDPEGAPRQVCARFR